MSSFILLALGVASGAYLIRAAMKLPKDYKSIDKVKQSKFYKRVNGQPFENMPKSRFDHQREAVRDHLGPFQETMDIPEAMNILGFAKYDTINVAVVNVCRPEEVNARSLRLASERLRRANNPSKDNDGSEYLSHKVDEAKELMLKELQNAAEEDYKYLDRGQGSSGYPPYPPPPGYGGYPPPEYPFMPFSTLLTINTYEDDTPYKRPSKKKDD